MLNKILLLNKRTVWAWVSAGLVSAILLAGVLWHIEIESLNQMISNIIWPYIFFAFSCLTAEGIITAMRIRLFASGNPCLTEALRANAWYVLLLVMLPARLGEVAAILILEKYLNQKYGAAAISIIAQRLFDIIVLGTFFLIALVSLSDIANHKALYGIAVFFMIIAALILYNIEKILSFIATLAQPKKSSKLIKKILRLILQARIWKRHIFQARDITSALILTALKWLANLSSIVFLLLALHINLPLLTSSAIAAAYNFLAAIPLQTIGGIGIGEAGMTLLLDSAGVSTAMAAGASILMRLVIIGFPFIFWALVMIATRIRERYT